MGASNWNETIHSTQTDLKALAEAPFAERFRYGCRFPWLGLRMLASQRQLWIWAAIPAIINSILMLSAFVFVWLHVDSWAAWLWQDPETGWIGILWHAYVFVLGFACFFALFVVIYVVGSLLATPFYDRLSEEVEAQILGLRNETVTWQILLGDILYSVWHSLLALVVWFVGLVVLFGLNAIPLAGALLEFLLNALFTSVLLAREMTDGAMSRRRLSFRHKFRIVVKGSGFFGGLGFATMMTQWIPFMNFITLPAGICGGTLMFCCMESQGLLAGPEKDKPYEVDPAYRQGFVATQIEQKG